MIRRIRYKLNNVAAQYFVRKMAYFPPRLKVVSFTFDDFPRSALENGARILECNNVRGTYYVSLGISGTVGPSGQIVDEDGVLDLSKRGHEVGCHTFAHLDFAKNQPQQILSNCLINQQKAFCLSGIKLRSFAYPFGRYTFGGKRILLDKYETARTVSAGVNVGAIDLAALHGVALYEKSGLQAAEFWLNRLKISGGWLIFYTHDVSDRPSKFGCSENLLSNVLDLCLSQGLEIVPVGDATKICD